MSTTTNHAAATTSQVIYRGINEIAQFVGINPKQFVYYKDKLDLPVFKADARSKIYLATRGDLVAWVEKRKEIYLEENRREPRNK